MMMRIIFSAAVALATPALAADVVALSPEAREAALNRAAERNSELPINGLDRKIHGEVGMAIGTGGYRSMYGTAVVPLGQTGTAVISVANEQFNGGRYRRR